MNIKTSSNYLRVGKFLAQRILRKLKARKKVLWLVCGGSSIKVAVASSRIISNFKHQNLTVTLTDERYGEVGHKDSNWEELRKQGFLENLKKATFVPILSDNTLIKTARNFDEMLFKKIKESDFRIALFGVGQDGHIAGILPNSKALKSKSFAIGYKTEKFKRITMTFRAIEKMDEIVVYMEGEDKKEILEKLTQGIDIKKMPSQILKKLTEVNLFYSQSAKIMVK